MPTTEVGVEVPGTDYVWDIYQVFIAPSKLPDRRNRKTRRQRSSLLFGGRTRMPHLPLSSKDDLKKRFLKNIHFGRVVVWCGVNHGWSTIIFWSIHSAKRLFFYSSFSSNHPGAKSVVGHGFKPPNSSDDICLLFWLSWIYLKAWTKSENP